MSQKLTSVKTFNIYKGTAVVTATLPPVATTTFKYGPITVHADTEIVSATLRYYVKPDSFPSAAGFVVNLNGIKIAEEAWSVFTGADSRTNSFPVNLNVGDNYFEITWSIVYVLPGWSTHFDTKVTLEVEFTGSSPETPTEMFTKYITYGFIILGVAAVAVIALKVVRR